MVITSIPSAEVFQNFSPTSESKQVMAPGVAQTIAQYEVLSQPLAPVKDVPYVQQGFFVQVANLQNETAIVTLNFVSKTPFSGSPTPPIMAFADYIVDNGAPVFYQPFFNNPVGFAGIQIPGNSSVIFGVQYIYNPQLSAERLGTTPQQTASSRGTVTFASTLAGRYGILPTVRQVFTTFDANFKPVTFSESAYAVPLISLVNV